ncbi:MAG: helix-turn-helix domain-containing protein [Nevskia sp.]|nr:helix-turn-helix domain-containing protein [Nevskia sp.]
MPFDAAPQVANTDCLVCPVRSCLGRRGNQQQTSSWSEMLAPRRAVMPGSGSLHRSGDRLRQLFSVRGGCIKAYTVDSEGNERIRGFYLPGDLVGLDGLSEGVCLSTAAAIVPSQVCVAPVSDLKQLMAHQPELAQRMLEQTSRELALALAVGGDYSAEQRLAAFLLHMRARMDSGNVLRLPMPQRDVGNYLRLATETVCRTLKSMERRSWLSLADKAIRILDEAALRQVAEAVGIVQAPLSLARAA